MAPSPGWLALALLAAPGPLSSAAPVPSPPAAGGTLAVWSGEGWRTWWRADRAPVRWTAPDSTLAAALRWETLAPGLEWASARLGCGAPAWRARLVVARLDPSRLSLSLSMDLDRDARPAWSIDRAPSDAVLAVNAGQFVGSMPWGWVATDGVERLRPGSGPLVSAIAIDAAGTVRWRHQGGPVPANAVMGFQSYPTLLAGDGRVPGALRDGRGGLSLHHRDARLALGQARDGRLLIALTRYDLMGEAAGGVPLGPTTPEMAAVMGALGAADAVMLDGGISAQLLLRGAAGPPRRWHGVRQVPLGLVARPRRGF